jgi:NAD+ diphosphatase
MKAPGFTGAGLDRADHIRLDADGIATAMARLDARVLTMAGLDPLLGPDMRLTWNPLEDNAPERLILLGFDGDAPRFAPLVADAAVGERAWRLFQLLGEMEPGEAAIWGTARSLNEWHGRHGFCPRCGHPTRPFRAGWGRICDDCGSEHFPRVDPVVIMLAEHEGRVLLGREHQYPPRRYSALAGFVEPGESIEEAVARELHEEAGVRVGAVRYVASQPWPFPGSLMIACIAAAATDAITLDTNELEDAMWVDAQAVSAALAGGEDAPFQAPPHFAIANTLLTRWLAEQGI